VRLDVPEVAAGKGPRVEDIPPSPADRITEASITFDFFLDSIRGHEDLFQTSDLNEGIRLELAAPGDAVVVVGSPDETNLVGIALSTGLHSHQWNHFSLSVDVTGRVIGQLNDESQRATIRRFPRGDRILVGSGFSGLRPFHGQLRNCAIDISFGTRLGRRRAWLVTARILLAALTLLACCCALPPHWLKAIANQYQETLE
jgi:hypothetical protein